MVSIDEKTKFGDRYKVEGTADTKAEIEEFITENDVFPHSTFLCIADSNVYAVTEDNQLKAL